MTNSVNFSPSTISLSVSGDYFVGTTRVSLNNCNGGYKLDTASLPSGVTVSGCTGNNGDNLTIKVPITYGNQSIKLRATGYDSRTSANLAWYGPKSGSSQNIMVVDTLFGPGGEGVLTMTTSAYGKIQIVKSGSGGEKLANTVFGVCSSAACTNEVARLTTNSNGTAITGDLLVGTYYVKEIDTPKGYILNPQVHTANVVAATYMVNASNNSAMGQIEVTKINSNPPMGNYSLAGAVFEVLSGSTVVPTITTDATGQG